MGEFSGLQSLQKYNLQDKSKDGSIRCQYPAGYIVRSSRFVNVYLR